MHATPTDTGPRCATHGESMAGGRACQACLESPLSDEVEGVGFYEQQTIDARHAGLMSRIEAERAIVQRATQMTAFAASLQSERDAIDGNDRESFAMRALLASLIIKAHEAGGKDLRHASTMILFRERAADAERADRLYADRQRLVARERSH